MFRVMLFGSDLMERLLIDLARRSLLLVNKIIDEEKMKGCEHVES